MKTSPFRSTFLCLGAFVVLLGFVLFFANDSVDKRSKEARLMKPVLSASAFQAVDRFHFLSADQQVVFSQADDAWTVGDSQEALFPVDPDQLAAVLTSLEGFPRGKAVSHNAENWSDYGILETSDRVQLYSGDQSVLEFQIGSPASSSQSFYSKREGQDAVYQVKSDLSRYVKYDLNFWLNKDVIPFEFDDVDTFTVRLGEEKWSFEGEGSLWVYDDDGKSLELQDEESFQNYLSVFDNLTAATVQRDQVQLDRVDHAVSLVKPDGSELVISIQQDDDQALLQITDIPYLLVYPADITATLRPTFLENLLEQYADEASGDEQEVSPEEAAE